MTDIGDLLYGLIIAVLVIKIIDSRALRNHEDFLKGDLFRLPALFAKKDPEQIRIF